MAFCWPHRSQTPRLQPVGAGLIPCAGGATETAGRTGFLRLRCAPGLVVSRVRGLAAGLPGPPEAAGRRGRRGRAPGVPSAPTVGGGGGRPPAQVLQPAGAGGRLRAAAGGHHEGQSAVAVGGRCGPRGAGGARCGAGRGAGPRRGGPLTGRCRGAGGRGYGHFQDVRLLQLRATGAPRPATTERGRDTDKPDRSLADRLTSASGAARSPRGPPALLALRPGSPHPRPPAPGTHLPAQQGAASGSRCCARGGASPAAASGSADGRPGQGQAGGRPRPAPAPQPSVPSAYLAQLRRNPRPLGRPHARWPCA